MSYSLENALFQWQAGEEAVRDAGSPALERAAATVRDELRKRLGSAFQMRELVALYAEGTDWAEDVASRAGAYADSSAAVDAAFARYAREATDFAGGRMQHRERREA